MASPEREWRDDDMDMDRAGPGIWSLLHVVSFNDQYDLATKRMLIYRIIDNVFCRRCRTYATEYTLNNQLVSDAARWVFVLHNVVNQKLGKPEFSWADCVSMWGASSH